MHITVAHFFWIKPVRKRKGAWPKKLRQKIDPGQTSVVLAPLSPSRQLGILNWELGGFGPWGGFNVILLENQLVSHASHQKWDVHL